MIFTCWKNQHSFSQSILKIYTCHSLPLKQKTHVQCMHADLEVMTNTGRSNSIFYPATVGKCSWERERERQHLIKHKIENASNWISMVMKTPIELTSGLETKRPPESSCIKKWNRAFSVNCKMAIYLRKAKEILL